MQSTDLFSFAGMDEKDIYALRALKDGEATPEQQVAALHTIIHKVSRAYSNPYSPGSFDKTSFQAGRSVVGQQIHFIVTADADAVLSKIKTSEQTEKTS